MPSPLPDRPSKQDWLARIEPALSTSLADAERRLTRAAPIQSWLHGPAMEAAQPPEGFTEIEAQAMAHRWVLDDLAARFPELTEAVAEATAGCAALSIHWRPLAPDYTLLRLDFGSDAEPDVFCRMAESTMDEAQRAVETVAAALPESRPFPKRPNTVTGIVASGGRCLGVRIAEHLRDENTRERSATLLPAGQPPIEDLRLEEAPRRLLDLLGSDG